MQNTANASSKLACKSCEDDIPFIAAATHAAKANFRCMIANNIEHKLKSKKSASGFDIVLTVV